MELLIDDFLIHMPLILPLINQFKLSIESSKGIYAIYLFPFPFLIINIITNDFPTTNQLNKFNTHINLADLIVILGSIDSALGSVDIIINIVFLVPLLYITLLLESLPYFLFY